jgi:hypothetical protein
MLAPGNILISLFAAGSLSYLVYKVKAPFKSHSFNTFAYIILLLIVYALIGKHNKPEIIRIVRVFYFFVDKNEIDYKIQGFLATYPCINLVICSYLLSNQW